MCEFFDGSVADTMFIYVRLRFGQLLVSVFAIVFVCVCFKMFSSILFILCLTIVLESGHLNCINLFVCLVFGRFDFLICLLVFENLYVVSGWVECGAKVMLVKLDLDAASTGMFL